MTPWWDLQTAVWIGAAGGGGLGTLGGVLGALAGTLAPRGIGKPVVLGGFAVVSLLGMAALAAGLTGLFLGQPYHVWYPLVLGGGILTFVVPPLAVVARNRYRLAEQRRLGVEEFRRG